MKLFCSVSPRRLFRYWSLVFGAIGFIAGPHPECQAQDTKPLYFQIRNLDVGVQVEAEREYAGGSDNGNDTTYDRIFMGPRFGLDCFGWSYHPNLLQFRICGDISPGYATERQTGDNPFDRGGTTIIGNYSADFDFLSRKPYRTKLYLRQSYNQQDYDYFNSAEVDTITYGLNTGYNTGPVPVKIDLWHRVEDTHGSTNDTTVNETQFSLEASHTRARGRTNFVYSYNNYEQDTVDSQGGGAQQTFTLTDNEKFGSRDQAELALEAMYNDRNASDAPGYEFQTLADLTVEHTPTLSSFYNLSYNRNTDDSSVGSTTSDNTYAEASLRHQLYKSLTSTVRFYGGVDSVDGSYESDGVSNDTSSDTSRYGGGFAENYTKLLGKIGRLTLYGSLMLDHVTVDNGSNTIIRTDEAHNFSVNQAGDSEDSFFLNQQDVDQGSIVITDDKNHMPAYVKGRDYTVSQNGSLTMIRRTPSSTIPVKSTVLVDYRAASPGSGDYNSITSMANLRVDLWDGKLSMYSHWSSIQNNASENLEVQNTDSYAIGMETRWRWVRAGAEYSIYDSNFSDYSSVRFFESFSVPLDQRSTWSLDFVQTFSDYSSSNRTENSYWFLTRYQRHLADQFWFDLDSGLMLRRGEGVDETEGRIHPSLEFRIGRLRAKLNYTYEYREYLDSSARQRHLLFFSAERKF